jgi:HlyD family secretion protein
MLKKSLFLVALGLVILVGGIVVVNNKKPVYDFVVVKRGNLTQEVSSTGEIKPAQAVELAFEMSGKVVSILAEVGDKVVAGQILASLENNDLQAQLEEAQANLQSQQAELAGLERGTRTEEIKVYEAKLDSARIGLEEAEKSLADKIKDAYTKADDSVRNRVDKLFNNPRTSSAQLIFTLSDSELKQQIEFGRVLVEETLVSWNGSLAGLTSGGKPTNYLDQAKTSLEEVKNFLEKIALAVNSLSVNPTLSQTTLDSWKSEVATARINTGTAMTNLLAAEEKYNNAKAALSLAQKELELEQAGASKEEIDIQEAQVLQAQAQVKSAESALRETLIFSPIDGVVTRQDAKEGEIVTQNVSLIDVISSASYEIRTNVPEVDIAKVKVGDLARVTLDALGSDTVLQGRVVKIDPAEILIEGVPTYKVSLQLLDEDARIKSGMTADVDILTAQRENVLFLPQRVVATKNSQKFVRVLDEKNQVTEKEVKTGLRGSSGEIEILEGLNEGDRVIISTK